MARPWKRIILAWTGDQHNGSTTALCPDVVRLDDGGEYRASKPQRWLFGNWLRLWERVAAIRDSWSGSRLITGFNGDLTDGDHHGTSQILSGNPNAQAFAVNACMAPVLKLKPDAMVFVRGTEAHVGKSACYEERIADGLRRDGWPVQTEPITGASSWWKWQAELAGVRVDSLHHGRMGQRPWTKPNIVANLAAEIFYEHSRLDAMRGDGQVTFPQLALRSHLHRFVDTHDQHPVRVIQMPAWQLHTAYTHKVAAESLADIGGIIVKIEGGAYEVEPVLFTAERSPVWRP